MSKRKSSATTKRRATARNKTLAADAAAPDSVEQQVVFGSGNLSLHELFRQDAMRMLERTDLDEEQKQQILLSMACPCCGAGAMSYTVKLKK